MVISGVKCALICLSVVHKMFPLLFKDILENDDIKLDMTFMQSLCMDLVEVIHHCCFVFLFQYNTYFATTP